MVESESALVNGYMKSKEKNIAQQVRGTIEDHALLTGVAHVVIGVSAGPDSTALLSIMNEMSSDCDITLVAVYVDHGLRPSETGEEARFVRHMAGELGIAFEEIPVDVAGYAAAEKLSLEHGARDLRYRALRSVAAKYPQSVIAVAHNGDDQAEEVLLRLFRGSGRLGLSGMRYKNGDIIRPLLDISKQQILEYLKSQNLSYCVDSSNFDDRFLRNRIRRELLPYLEERFDKGIRGALIKSASILAEDEELLEQLAADAFRQCIRWEEQEDLPAAVLERDSFCRLSGALQRRVVEKMLWQLGSRAHYDHIMTIIKAAHRGTTGTELHLKQGLRAGVLRSSLRFSYPKGRCAWRGRLHSRS